MTDTETAFLKDLAKRIEFGPTRHGEVYPFALKIVKEAFEAGVRSCKPAEQQPETTNA